MSDDLGTEEEQEPRDSAAVRDDIMKRLLDYQRRLRLCQPPAIGEP